MNKSFLTILAVLSLLLAACVQAPASNTGRTVFAITDAAADMGTVTSVKITVDSISAHTVAEGWTTVSSTPMTYDLLQLKSSGDTVMMADVRLNTGEYQQVRLAISNVEVTDANGTHQAKLPSGDLKIVGGFNVSSNTTAAVKFDFIADESLHVTGNGKYIFAPVVQYETREGAEIRVGLGNKVDIDNGNVKTNVKVGMDIAGNVGEGLKIGLDDELEIEGSEIKVLAKGIKDKVDVSGNMEVGIGG